MENKMNIQEISKEAKQEVKRLLEDNSNPSIRISVLAANLSIFMEENENLKNQIENIKEEIQILTGDLRASADALDDLD
tara:strand:- start:1192 stop:1428 length:237 start_codon:yes stop_codon:yes gene_type:complete